MVILGGWVGGDSRAPLLEREGVEGSSPTPFASRLPFRIFLLPTETKVESGTSQSKSGISVELSKSGNPQSPTLQGYLAYENPSPRRTLQ